MFSWFSSSRSTGQPVKKYLGSPLQAPPDKIRLLASASIAVYFSLQSTETYISSPTPNRIACLARTHNRVINRNITGDFTKNGTTAIDNWITGRTVLMGRWRPGTATLPETHFFKILTMRNCFFVTPMYSTLCYLESTIDRSVKLGRWTLRCCWYFTTGIQGRHDALFTCDLHKATELQRRRKQEAAILQTACWEQHGECTSQALLPRVVHDSCKLPCSWQQDGLVLYTTR